MTSVVVFDYGFGNVRSMVRALANLDLDVTLTSDYRQSLEADGMPFAVRRKHPNRETLRAMEEARALAHDPNAKYVTTLEELRAELEK